MKESRLGAGDQDNEFTPNGDVPLAMERDRGEQGLSRANRIWQNLLEPGRGLNGEVQIAT